MGILWRFFFPEMQKKGFNFLNILVSLFQNHLLIPPEPFLLNFCCYPPKDVVPCPGLSACEEFPSSSAHGRRSRVQTCGINPDSLPVCSGRAISFVLKELFQPSRGMRPGFPHILVLVTDGQSQDDVLPPARAAHALGRSSQLYFPWFSMDFHRFEVASLCFPWFSLNFHGLRLPSWVFLAFSLISGSLRLPIVFSSFSMNFRGVGVALLCFHGSP